MKKLSKVIAFIQCNGLWFAGKAWGVSWKMTAASVNPSQQTSNVKQPPALSDKERELFGSVMTNSYCTLYHLLPCTSSLVEVLLLLLLLLLLLNLGRSPIDLLILIQITFPANHWATLLSLA